MTFYRWFTSYLCHFVLLTKVVLTIRQGVDVTLWRPHNRPVVLISHRYPQEDTFAVGNLLNRRFILTALLSLPEQAENITIRIGSLHSLQGGLTREITKRWTLKRVPNDKRMHLVLAYFDLPFDHPRPTFAFVAAKGLSPLGFWEQSRELFVVSGWNGDGSDTNLSNHMNMMLLKTSNIYACHLGYVHVEQYINSVNVMECYCPASCAELICSTDQFPGRLDSGAGIYVAGTNLLVSISQSQSGRIMDQVNTISTLVNELQPTILRLINKSPRDTYEEFPEFDTKKRIF